MLQGVGAVVAPMLQSALLCAYASAQCAAGTGVRLGRGRELRDYWRLHFRTRVRELAGMECIFENSKDDWKVANFSKL